MPGPPRPGCPPCVTGIRAGLAAHLQQPFVHLPRLSSPPPSELAQRLAFATFFPALGAGRASCAAVALCSASAGRTAAAHVCRQRRGSGRGRRGGRLAARRVAPPAAAGCATVVQPACDPGAAGAARGKPCAGSGPRWVGARVGEGRASQVAHQRRSCGRAPRLPCHLNDRALASIRCPCHHSESARVCVRSWCPHFSHQPDSPHAHPFLPRGRPGGALSTGAAAGTPQPLHGGAAEHAEPGARPRITRAGARPPPAHEPAGLPTACLGLPPVPAGGPGRGAAGVSVPHPRCACSAAQVDPEGVIARQDLFSVYVHTMPGFYYGNSKFCFSNIL